MAVIFEFPGPYRLIYDNGQFEIVDPDDLVEPLRERARLTAIHLNHRQVDGEEGAKTVATQDFGGKVVG